MSKAAKRPQKPRIITDIISIEQKDAGARAHTRTHNALVHDADRIEAARWAAERLAAMLYPPTAGWSHYSDSCGGVVSVRT